MKCAAIFLAVSALLATSLPLRYGLGHEPRPISMEAPARGCVHGGLHRQEEMFCLRWVAGKKRPGGVPTGTCEACVNSCLHGGTKSISDCAKRCARSCDLPSLSDESLDRLERIVEATY